MNSIKTNFKIYSEILGKKFLIFMVISLFLFNILQMYPIFPDISFTYNLLLSYTNFYYIFAIYFFCIFIIFKLLNNYKEEYYLFLRYKNIEDYGKKLFLTIIVLLSLVFLLNFVFSIIASLYLFDFNVTDSVYDFYSIKNSLYGILYYFKTFVIICSFAYMSCKLFLKFKEIIPVIIFTILFVLSFFLFSNANLYDSFSFIIKLFSVYYINLINEGSLFNEILTFIFYFIIKFGVFNFLLNIDMYFNKNLLKINLYNLINKRKHYLFLLLYIIVNVIIYLTSYDINFLLFSLSDSYMNFETIVMLLCSYFSLISLLYSYMAYDTKNDSYIYRTRINKREYNFNKIIIAFIIVLILRLPIYLIARNSFILFDMLIYLISVVVICILSHLKEV